MSLKTNAVEKNIRNVENFLNSVWDWGFTNDCFPYGMRISDVDGIFERYGYFLVLETKHPKAEIPGGQRFMHEQLVRTGLFTVIYIWGENEQSIESIEVISPKNWGKRGGIKTTGRIKSSTNHFKTNLKLWYNRVENSSDKHGNFKPKSKNYKKY